MSDSPSAEARIRARLPELRAQLSPELWEWSMLGDNTFAAWNFAYRLEREEGIDHQAVLTVVAADLVSEEAKR